MSAHSVIVIGATGGCGASTLAAGIAFAWADADRHPLLVDADIERGDLAERWDVPRERTIADLAAIGAELDSTQIQRVTVPGPSGLRIVASPGNMTAAAEWDEPAARRLCTVLCADDDVVFDASGQGCFTRAAIACCRTVLLACPVTLGGLRRAARVVADARVNEWDERLAIVSVRVPGTRISERALSRAIDQPVIGSLPWDERGAQAITNGRWPSGRKRSLIGGIQALADVIA